MYWLLLNLFAAALILSRLGVSAGFRLGLVDRPDARKHHSGKVALTGGISILLTIAYGVLFLSIEPYTTEMLLIAIVVFLVAVFDDVHTMSATARLVIEFGCGILLATVGGIAIHNVGDLLGFGDIYLAVLTVPLTALSVAGLSNAYNMIDGIDGLAAGLVAVPLALLFLLALQAGHPNALFLLLVLTPVIVFLLFNLGPNNRVLPKMFLGDAGSISLGFIVTASLVFFSQGDNALINPVTALWLSTVPLMDMLATMLRRAKNGVPLMEADRRHFHYTLIDTLGMSRRGALAATLTYSIAAACLGLALEAAPEYVSMAAYFVLFGLHCLYVIRSERTAAYLARAVSKRP